MTGSTEKSPGKKTTTNRKRNTGSTAARRPSGEARHGAVANGCKVPKRVANNAPGFFITLEGGEGAGKSSQMSLLKEKLGELGHEVVTSREPGGSPGAEAVRHVLLSGAAEPFGAEMEAILFSAARGDHVDTVIRPALAEGKIVISDRFFDSTRVYQGVSGKVEESLVRHLEEVACNETWPDLTIIIDLDPQEGMARAGKRRNKDEAPDRFEKESLKLQQLRREGYLTIAREEPQRCVVVDGSGDEKTVFDRIWRAVQTRLPKRPGKAKQKKPASARKLPHKKLTVKKASGSAAKTKGTARGGR